MRNKWEHYLWLPLIFSLLLLVVPQFSFVKSSFYADLEFGAVSEIVSLDSYRVLFSEEIYRNAFFRTLYLSAGATCISLILALPTAYSMSRSGRLVASVGLNAIIAISLVSISVKLLGLNVMLAGSGVINQSLIALGLIDTPIQLLNNRIGVLVGLVQYTLPITILMLYSVMSTIPAQIEEAAHIHGATRSATFFRLIVPLASGGLLNGGLIAFNMCMGAFTSPLILGGGRVLTIPVLIQQKMIAEAKYSVAAALSVSLVLFVFAVNLFLGLAISRRQKLSRRRRAWHARLQGEVT
ncbi:MAG: ABC transporter permease [Nitratireductor sp.]|nr:ABC transporter permease [Nitratireductor sp.]